MSIRLVPAPISLEFSEKSIEGDACSRRTRNSAEPLFAPKEMARCFSLNIPFSLHHFIDGEDGC